MGDLSRTAERDLVRLVRYVAGHRVTIGAPADDGGVVLQRSGAQPRAFPQAVFQAALSRGLLAREDETLLATPDASAFLRRAALCAADPQGGAEFQDQHRDLGERQVVMQAETQRVRVNLAESPLGALARLKDKAGQPYLPAEALEAGARLHADFTRGQLQPRMTMDYAPRLSTKTRGASSGSAAISDTALAARLRVRAALEAVGPELSGVALDVCGFEKGLETVERERQWPARSAKLMLRAALMALARHYAPPLQPPRARRHAWGEEGYRPAMADAVLAPSSAADLTQPVHGRLPRGCA